MQGKVEIYVRIGYEERTVQMPKGSTLRDLLLQLVASFGTEATEFLDVEKGELHPDCQVFVNGEVKTREPQVELKDGDRVKIERIVIAGG